MPGPELPDEESLIKTRLRDFITIELIHDAEYPLEDDEALITANLVDTTDLDTLAAFVADAFGVILNPDDLVTGDIDSLNDLVTLIDTRLE